MTLIRVDRSTYSRWPDIGPCFPCSPPFQFQRGLELNLQGDESMASSDNDDAASKNHDTRKMLIQALRNHQAGREHDAEDLYRRILDVAPLDPTVRST